MVLSDTEQGQPAAGRQEPARQSRQIPGDVKVPLPKQIWKRFERTRVGRSIFRVGLPQSNLERSQAMVSSFLLHIQPAKVHRHSLRASYSFGLGLISLYLFLILTVTGVLLMFYYVPSTDHAYNVMKDLRLSFLPVLFSGTCTVGQRI